MNEESEMAKLAEQLEETERAKEAAEAEADWLLDRMPEIKAELSEHGYVMVEEKLMDAGRAGSVCLLWLLGVVAGPLIGAGLTQNHFLGAGLGLAAVGTGAAIWTGVSHMQKKARGL